MNVVKENLKSKIKLTSLFQLNNITILLMLITGLWIFFSFQSEFFLTQMNITNIFTRIAIIGIIAVPMTFVIISKAMDLSVGSILGLTAVTLGFLHQSGWNIWIAVLAALVVSALCGALNGVLVAKYQMQAIVVTIGTLVMLRGIVYIITQGSPISGYPESFYFLGQGKIGVLPVNVLFMFMVFAIGYYIIKKTRFGRYTYALGNNEETVWFSGINVVRTRFMIFLVNGVFAGIAGVFYVSQYASAQSDAGSGIELDVITAVLIGGTHIFGGRGSLIGTLLGVILIGTLRNGLNLIGVSSLYQTVILGILILIAVSRQNK